MPDDALNRMERSTFKAAADSGLWDIFLASVVAMFAIAPLLSRRLGDFWSSAIFLPVWAVVYLVIHLVKKRVVEPRIGVVKFSPPRRKRLMILTLIMVAVNLVALIAGIFAATQDAPGQAPILVRILPFIVILVGFSLAALLLWIPRLLAYGLLLAAAPFVGEALFKSGHATHHGFPVVFGVSALVILACGIVRFVTFLPRRPGCDGAPGLEGNRG